MDNVTFVHAATAHIHVQVEQSTTPEVVIDKNRAIEATHKSTTAEYAPKCNPKTRLQVISDLVHLVTAEVETSKSVFWFNGPAGAGKTCIMRELINRCEALPETMVMSYFFSTLVPELDDSKPFIATLAHQLTQMGVPGLKEYILQVVSVHSTIFRDGLESQAKDLIIKPLRATVIFSPLQHRQRIVLVVDGLDECRDEAQRQHLISLFLFLTASLYPWFVVVIASRPELDIRMRFGSPKVALHTHTIQLHDYDGREDVRVFYCDEFEEIRASHPLRHYIPSNWPDEDTLQTLIDKSSGHFIYPATIMKYIAHHPRKSPVDILDKVLPVNVTEDNPLADLDALYRTIAHPPEVDFALLRRLLQTTHFVSSLVPFRFLSPEFLDALLNLRPGTVEATFSDLHAVIEIGKLKFYRRVQHAFRLLSFHHKSFGDFLQSPERSQDLFEPQYRISGDVLLSCAHFYTSTRINGRGTDHMGSWRLEYHGIVGVYFQECFGSTFQCWLEACGPWDSLPQDVVDLAVCLTPQTHSDILIETFQQFVNHEPFECRERLHSLHVHICLSAFLRV